ncbi:hypothetical protein BpHYR1_026413 [Brachionus plicatilis]|uniref:SWIM-type domain-containing protein n=1 Tax=Brachionus plicatilis TaxID=10195 RepID=A0A3M7PI30_BRAPC|nr:hypothetical protein BpHYR1_026413 [Brachionus plicatilis]
MSDSESSSTSILRTATQNQPGLDTDDEIDSIEVDLKPKRGKSKVYDEFQRYASHQEALKQAIKNVCSSFLEENQWTSFDLYVKSINSIRSVSINNSNWQLSVCSCPYWNKNYVCKHTVGIANKLDLNTFPGLNLNIEANEKR